MKKRIIILAVALICVLVLCAGCGSLSAVKEAKAMIGRPITTHSRDEGL